MRRELIQHFAETHDEEAFRQIVADHINLVYSCARRRLGDAHAAEDATQAVFLILARKARSVPSDAALPGWLFRTTQFVTADLRVSMQRRQRHEREAATMSRIATAQEPISIELQASLDAALEQLGGGERDAILLRYFKGLSVQETALALGIPENTASKRISRALEKLRGFLARKGLRVGVPTLAAGLCAAGAETAPPALAATVVQSALIAPSSLASSELADLAARAIRAMRWAHARTLLWLAGSTTAAVLAIAVVLQQSMAWHATAKALPTAVHPTPPVSAPGIPLPLGLGSWPITLPGTVTGTPAVADLDGDGDLEIVVPAMQRRGQQLLHPSPTLAATVFAFHANGQPMQGWPIVLLDEPGRLADRQRRPNYSEDWAASPSVADLDGNGRDEIVITAPPRVTHILNSQRPIVRSGVDGGEVWSSFPIVDVDGDGRLDLLCNIIALTATGQRIPGWSPTRFTSGQPPMHGFAGCIGDANGDGEVEIYFSEFRPGSLFHGLDRRGRQLPGWPRWIVDQCLFPPVMGDVDGDGKMEVFATDGGGHLMGWRWDGRAILPGVSRDGLTGVFKDGISGYSASPALADLDGDGRAEVILFDNASRTLRAWRGDGRGLRSADGIISRLPAANCAGAVTVADIGADGVMDLFVGVHWVKLARDGTAVVSDLVANSADVRMDAGCLITDVDRDGNTELVFGLADGRVFIHRTEMRYQPNLMQWPAPNGGLRHTGVWRSVGADR